jgi:sugar phosphate isomerase/epimerase
MKIKTSDLNPFKLSIAISDDLPKSYPSLIRGDWVDSIYLAKQYGFDAVEIHTNRPKDFPWDKVVEVCQKEEMEVSGISSGLSYSLDGLNVLSTEKEIRENAHLRFKEYIDLSQKLKCNLIVGLMRGLVPNNKSTKEYQLEFASYIPKLLSYAEEKNVTLVLEAINRYENNFLLSAKDVVDFVKPFNSPLLKILLDSYHMNIEESDLVDSIYSSGLHIGYFHCSDSNRKVPGYGHIDFKAIIRALWKVGYNGYLSVEALAIPSPEIAAKQSSSLLRNIINVISYEVEHD